MQHVGGGRLIPVLVVDTRERPDLVEMVRIHKHVDEPGDVTVTWARGVQRDTKHIHYLELKFARPAPCHVILPFDLDSAQIGLLDNIMTSRGFYFQIGGEAGEDPVLRVQANPAILVEIPVGVEVVGWDAEYLTNMTRQLRNQNRRLSRREAREMAKAVLGKWRQMSAIRISP